MRRLRLSRRGAPGRMLGTAGSVLAAVLAAGALSACDASPYAATVNGSTIKEAALNTELRWAAGALDYSSTKASFYDQVASAQLTLHGDNVNTYSSGWAAFTLSQMIEGQLLRQAVQARGEAPSSDLYSAALGGIEIENGGVTGTSGTGGVTQMNPSYLVDVTQRLADHADLETPMPIADLEAKYTNYEADFYAQVCVTEASVSVSGASGGVDFAASKAQASTVAQKLANSGANAADVGGASTCYTHEQLDAQSASFINTVVRLAPGQASIQKTNYGYQVVAVSSRQTLPLAGPVAQVLSTLNYDLTDPADDPVLKRLESEAKVRVNPAYGSWMAPTSTSLAAVVAPSASPAAPLGSAGSSGSSGSGSS